MRNELALVEKIRRFAQRGPQIALGPGDDCAIYRPSRGEDLLLKVDPMIENVHFKRAQPAAITGQRALARNLSDIAAMGGQPRFCLVSLAVPDTHTGKWLDEFYRGLLAMAKRTGTALAGGHLAKAPQIFIDVTVGGVVPRGRALLRSGARPGDGLYVSGKLGKPWTGKIEPRLGLGERLLGLATSCMDISDGLSIDLHRLCKASGVAADVERLPIYRGATVKRALHGGEDYELLFTLPPGATAPRGCTRIGSIKKGAPGAVSFQGAPLRPLGHDHFA